jgi:hypothetical protein
MLSEVGEVPGSASNNAFIGVSGYSLLKLSSPNNDSARKAGAGFGGAPPSTAIPGMRGATVGVNTIGNNKLNLRKSLQAKTSVFALNQ